ncbi:50S ribosomal protein L29 [candidate division WOR-1 bacterium RIFOXYC2_FULL_37_10]|uniref:Large ribosomal subunit protein uL29 n=1 Tax=candidate division WOR-1 bacterium RIFOXYB2_FULL_37_13 TaxID=1802579 RepID=A0A1F4SU18_UNCSA|nr:MAG: 50S ribosomal protein L29 [candidate division WOR-1 bacterium RIFOXYB2_FULL_37_13]OGC33547.1 MAG: 50S ribosomal protein L29 [candidate division WOR-1 bacterium RIFOXYC2_FULL_37_10]
MNDIKFKELTKDELLKEIQRLRTETKTLYFSKAKGEDKNPLKRRHVKRDIARILTTMKEKGWN